MMAKRKLKVDPTFADWVGDEPNGMPPNELTDALDTLFRAGPSAGEIEGAVEALNARLEKQLPPMVYYGELLDSTLGPVWVAVSGERLVAVDYSEREEEFVSYLNKLMDGRFRRSNEKVAWAAAELQAYLKGRRREFDLQVDLSHITDFQRRVLEETAKVPRGQVATYAEIAKRIGKPAAVRAVGQALRRNPVPIVVPCHRVVNSDGSLGGYGGRVGDERKVKLLKLEGVMLA